MTTLKKIKVIVPIIFTKLLHDLQGPIFNIVPLVRWVRVKIALNVVKASKLVQMKLIT